MYTHIIHCILRLQFSLSRNVCNSAEENQHDEFHLGNCFFFFFCSLRTLKHKICNALVCRADRFLCHIRQKLRFIYGFHVDIFFPVFFAIELNGELPSVSYPILSLSLAYLQAYSGNSSARVIRGQSYELVCETMYSIFIFLMFNIYH